MRWILVFIFLYLIPLIIVFKNYNNFKRSCIYSSIYVVLATSIVITNMYMSGLNKIEEAMYYQRYVSEYIDKPKEDYDSNKIEVSEDKDKVSQDTNKLDEDVVSDNQIDKVGNKNEEITNKENIKETMSNKTDIKIIDSFKEDIYEIEKIALMPMRDCMPYTKNIAENLKKLGSIRKDIEYARQKCSEAISEYENMEIPKLSTEEYTYVLDSARNDLVKTYELREKAMENALNLVDTKNPKYIGRVTEYLNLSDDHISSFKDRITDLKENVTNNVKNND